MPNITALKKDMEIITIDLPGFGDSGNITSVDSINEMVAQVLHTLKTIGCERFNLLGHSMGGMVALQMALLAHANIHKLILFATNSHGDLPERFESFAATKARVIKQGIDAVRREVVATWYLEGAAHPYYNLCVECSDNVSRETAVAALTAMEKFDVQAELHKIKCPTLIIAAECDRTYALHHLTALQKNIANSEICILKNCAHNAHLENPQAFQNALVGFIKDA